jgi:L-2-hydroxyglutarate oxidase LhgO
VRRRARRLYAYCAEQGIAHRRCGKLLVASGDAQRAKLALILAQGQRNGVDDLQWLDAGNCMSSNPSCTRMSRSGRRRPASSTATA